MLEDLENCRRSAGLIAIYSVATMRLMPYLPFDATFRADPNSSEFCGGEWSSPPRTWRYLYVVPITENGVATEGVDTGRSIKEVEMYLTGLSYREVLGRERESSG